MRRSLAVASVLLASLLTASPAFAATFTYSQSTTGITSAGVYDGTGTPLKTLWGNVPTTAGSHTGYWDGTDSKGSAVPAGNYEVRVLSSQVKYTWEGVIGNTSDQLSGPNIWHGNGNFDGLAVAGSYIYVPYGYDEGGTSMYKFSLTDPGTRYKIGPGGAGQTGYGEFFFVASDGNDVFWGGERMPRALLNFEKRALLSMTLSGLRVLGNSVVVYFLS
jgi:hypothetical protein